MTVEVTRGPLVESRHVVDWAVADVDGRLTRGEGDTESPVFLRSATKPFQAMAVLSGGAADAFGFTEPEVAIVGGSHHGEPAHLAAVRSILAKSGIPEDALQCGAHVPSTPLAARALAQAGQAPSALHSNCSGKHAGLLALARHIGAPLDTYRERGHPTEHRVFEAMAACCAVPAAIPFGVDGCGLPAAAVSLRVGATGFARFATSERLPPDVAAAARRLRDAQQRHPLMVNGSEGFNTRLLVVAPHLVAKSGAEGVFCVGNRTTGEGLALKARDGNNRAAPVATTHLLRRLGWLDAAAWEGLAAYHAVPIPNVAGETVGWLRAGAH